MMNISTPDQVARVALDPFVRCAVQSLPQHQIVHPDNRFDELLERLAQAERESGSTGTSGHFPIESVASQPTASSSYVGRFAAT
jgi:hypothetical protein